MLGQSHGDGVLDCSFNINTIYYDGIVIVYDEQNHGSIDGCWLIETISREEKEKRKDGEGHIT